MTTTVISADRKPLYNAFMDVFIALDCEFEGTASELLEKVALGNPDVLPEVLPADAARMSKALSDEIEPIAKARAESKGYKFIVDRYWKNKRKIIKIVLECQAIPCKRVDDGHRFCPHR